MKTYFFIELVSRQEDCSQFHTSSSPMHADYINFDLPFLVDARPLLFLFIYLFLKNNAVSNIKIFQWVNFNLQIFIHFDIGFLCISITSNIKL